MNDILLYEFKISFKLIKKFTTIINIVKQDKRLKCCYKTSMISRDKMVFMFFKIHLMILAPFANMIFSKKKSSCLLHKLL